MFYNGQKLPPFNAIVNDNIDDARIYFEKLLSGARALQRPGLEQVIKNHILKVHGVNLNIHYALEKRKDTSLDNLEVLDQLHHETLEASLENNKVVLRNSQEALDEARRPGNFFSIQFRSWIIQDESGELYEANIIDFYDYINMKSLPLISYFRLLMSNVVDFCHVRHPESLIVALTRGKIFIFRPDLEVDRILIPKTPVELDFGFVVANLVHTDRRITVIDSNGIMVISGG